MVSLNGAPASLARVFQGCLYAEYSHKRIAIRMKVALDAMGGDHAPAVNIGGAIDALRYYPKLRHLYLVGIQRGSGRGVLESRGSI